jgi:hypothetical protein
MASYVTTNVDEGARYAQYQSYDDVEAGTADVGAASSIPIAKSHRWISEFNYDPSYVERT